MFGQSPAGYLGIEENYLRLSVDLACAVAVWEDENEKYRASKETAGAEAVAIDRVLQNYKEQLDGR